MVRLSGLKVSTGIALAILAFTPAWSSSHREAPNITKMPKVDNTDVYAFRSYEPGRARLHDADRQFRARPGAGQRPQLLHAWIPNAVYEIMIDNNGDAIEDLTFQFEAINTLKGGTRRSPTPSAARNVPLALRHDGVIDTGAQEPSSPSANIYGHAGPRRSPQRSNRISVTDNAAWRHRLLLQAVRQCRQQDDPGLSPAYAINIINNDQDPGLRRRRAACSSASAPNISRSTSARSSTS